MQWQSSLRTTWTRFEVRTTDIQSVDKWKSELKTLNISDFFTLMWNGSILQLSNDLLLCVCAFDAEEGFMITCMHARTHTHTYTLSLCFFSLREALPLSAEPNVSHFLMEQITGRHAALSQGYPHVKFSNIRVKRPGLLLLSSMMEPLKSL